MTSIQCHTLRSFSVNKCNNKHCLFPNKHCLLHETFEDTICKVFESIVAKCSKHDKCCPENRGHLFKLELDTFQLYTKH